MNNVKYTLYCQPGRLFHAGDHYLTVGSWIPPDPDRYVILKHGTMSRNEYNDICTRYKLTIYEYAPVNWTDIFPYHDTGFFMVQKIGSLYKVSDLDVWKGGLINGCWR